eukprot:713453_1
MSTLKEPLIMGADVGSPSDTSVELKIRQEYGSTNQFEVLTNDISFTSKLGLLLWKNVKIQCIRRPKSCFAKCCVPSFVMLVMVLLLVLIPDLQPHTNDNAYGLELDYILSNTGDSADFTTLYPMNRLLPWPDSNQNANQWIKYIICDPNRISLDGGKDINPPSYLAIVAKDYQSNPTLQSLLNILNQSYGNTTYLQRFQSQTIASNTWYSYQVYQNQSHTPSSNPFRGSNEPFASEFVYTNCISQSSDTSFVNFTHGSLLKFFNSEKELEDYVTDSAYGNTGYNFDNTKRGSTRPIGAAIVFEETGGDDGITWEYTLRFNSSYIPATKTIIDKFTRNVDLLYFQSVLKYLELSGFIPLQNWIDQAITKHIIQHHNAQDPNHTISQAHLNSMTTEYSKGLFMFPTAKYQQSNFWNTVGGFFSFFLFIMFCYPVITVVSILVEEKQTKIKEGMKMMGATTSAYWLSWFIWFTAEFTFIALCVTLIGVGGKVFRYSDGIVIFLWFELFCISSAVFGMMISTLFDNPKSASLFGLIAFFAVLIGGQFSGSLDESGKTGLCLLAPACFVTSVPTLVQYEVSIIGLTFDNIHDDYGAFKFVTCLVMMAIDIVIYGVLTLYLDQVWPSKYGQKQSFWYFVLPSYWCPKFEKCCESQEKQQQNNLRLIRRLSSINEIPNYEPQGNSKGEAVISIRTLSKTFRSFFGSRKDVKAVKSVSMDMYRGEVFCLLGHNGAGKTTTIGMLTGLLEVTDGNAWILQNEIADPNTMSEVRRHLGVCPQHDVLWNRLTTREHLWLFARLKGVPQDRVDAEVEKILDDTGLAADRNTNKFPTQMSGGQRRKLSLGIALIGGSQIVFLDEPTSGMDPQSRRITWDLISNEKKNRCIILTTHFMDEADILGDRIAIMSNGEIKCCGSSLFLKQSYGVGYTMTVSLATGDDIVNDITNIKQQVDEYVFDTISGAQSVSLAGSELTYRLPFEQTACFSTLFDTLDDNKQALSIKSYGVSVTTLEEVFLKIGHDRDEGDEEEDDITNAKTQEDQMKDGMNALNKLRAKTQFKKPTISTFQLQDQKASQIFFIHLFAVLYKRFWWSLRDFKALLCSLIMPVALSSMALSLLNIQIVTIEPNIELSTADWYDSMEHTMIPVANNIGYVPNASQWYPIEDNFYDDNGSFHDAFVQHMQSDFGTIDLIDTKIDPNAVFENNDTNYKGDKLENIYFKTFLNANVSAYPSYYNITKSFQDWLRNESQSNYKSYYNAFLFMPYSKTQNQQKRVYFGVNGSALHALPTTLNLWNNWVIRYLLNSSSPRIKVHNNPLPPTTRQNLFGQQISGFAETTYITIAFSFIPAAAIYFIVNEKTKLTKHQQLVSGISFSAYWIANYITDFFVGLPSALLVFGSVFVFNTSTFSGEAAVPFLMVLLTFLFSAIPFTYLFSFVFSSPSKAQLSTILLFVITGIILGTVGFILDMIPSTVEANASLKGIYRIFPVYLMTESLFNISKEALLDPSKRHYWAWSVCGRNYVLMAIEGVLYFGVLLLLEYVSSFPALLKDLGFVTNRPLTETDQDLDVDVLEEKQRILKGLEGDGVNYQKLDDTVVIAGLRKVYDPAGTSRMLPCFSNVPDEDKIEAVKDLYFGVKQSEVFGFLGVNGAGKTTTLATLTGERYPSSGSAFIAQYSISNQLQCRRYVGYCPQFDAIFDLLTAKEHLKFYAMIKGLRGAEADEQVNVLLSALNLTKYRNRRAGTYSGGNKRKLSVAMAMIGNPPVIFLDEPSTGVDPVSRRFMWEFISTTMAGRCVILTTHSMEECEALCNRVGIMVNGQLQCIGTAQHLKSRFGRGYQLDITLTQRVLYDDEKEREETMNDLYGALVNSFGVVNLIEQNGSRVSYELIKNEEQLKLGQMFDTLEEIKLDKLANVIEAYSLSQTTLEQIFIRMAKQGEIDRDRKQT